MKPFDFLGSMGNSLNQYFATGGSGPSDTLKQFFPSKSQNLRMDTSSSAPQITPQAVPQATSQPQQQYQGDPIESLLASLQTQQPQPQQDYTQPDLESLLAILLLLGGGGYANG